MDSKAAISAIQSNRCTSKTVRECQIALNNISKENTVSIVWVPGHSGVRGNEIADSLARRGAGSRELIPKVTRRTTSSIAHELDQLIWTKITTDWTDRADCRVTRQLWQVPNLNKSRKLIELDRGKLRKAMALLTGHCLLGSHSYQMGLTDTSECKRCSLEEDTIEHFLCECQAIKQKRLKHLGCYVFQDLLGLSDIRIMDLIRFYEAVYPEN